MSKDSRTLSRILVFHIEILPTSSHIQLVRKKCVKSSQTSNNFPASLISEIIHLMFDKACAKVRKFDRPSIWLGRFEESELNMNLFIILDAQ